MENIKIIETLSDGAQKELCISDVKPRYLWSYVGSDKVNLPWKDYDIIDTYEDKVIESYNSPSMVKYRLKLLNNVV